MANKMRVQLGRGGAKNYFEYTYDKNDRETVRAAIKAYNEFFDNYRKTHTISARMWNFPILYIDDVARYVVTPNGNWDELRKES